MDYVLALLPSAFAAARHHNSQTSVAVISFKIIESLDVVARKFLSSHVIPQLNLEPARGEAEKGAVWKLQLPFPRPIPFAKKSTGLYILLLQEHNLK